MSVTNNKAITDSLVLYYDTANVKSYPGEPTTNLLVNNFVASYGNTTVESVSILGPDGLTTTAQKFSILAATGVIRNYLVSSIGIPVSGQYYTISMWIKKGSASEEMTAGWEAEVGSPDSYARPNIEIGYTGVYGQNPQTQGVSASWQRVRYTFMYSTQRTSNVVLFFYLSGTGGNIYTTGHQVEAKDHMTQYLPAGATRLEANGLRDLSSYGHNTSLSGTQFDKDSLPFNSVSGSNLQVDATTTILQNLTDNGNSHTYECWFKPLGNLPYSVTASHGYIFGRRGMHTGLRQNTSTNGNQIISAVLWFSDNSNTGVGTTYTCTLSSWYHLVLTVDEVNHVAKTYIDGVQNGSTVNLHKDLKDYASAPYFIGTGSSYSYPYIYSICGMVDCCRLYNKALTLEEVQYNFNSLKGRFKK
ncbi:MAG: LamG-like jellyroll fold domain-containing protein [Paludibacter sp.]